MKLVTHEILAAVSLLTALAASAGSPTLEDFAPHFPTNTSITWTAPTNHLPGGFWLYRTRPHIFSQTTISNAIILASLQDKGIPKPSSNELCMDYDSCPCGHPCTFALSPKRASLSFASPSFRNGSPEDIPTNETLARRARDCAAQLGLDPAQLVPKQITTNFCQYDHEGKLATNNACGRGITLSRRIDGIEFWGADLMQGFFIELGSHAQIRSFSLIWPELEPFETGHIASPEQVIACIRASKTLVPPDPNEPDYFARVKALSRAKKLTITTITPYYTEGRYGEEPKDQDTPGFISAIAELDVVAEFGNTNATFKLLSPIVSTDAEALLKRK